MELAYPEKTTDFPKVTNKLYTTLGSTSGAGTACPFVAYILVHLQFKRGSCCPIFCVLCTVLLNIVFFFFLAVVPTSICSFWLPIWFLNFFFESTTTHPSWAGAQVATLVVIGTACIGRCISNYHMITAMTSPVGEKWKDIFVKLVIWWTWWPFVLLIII